MIFTLAHEQAICVKLDVGPLQIGGLRDAQTRGSDESKYRSAACAAQSAGRMKVAAGRQQTSDLLYGKNVRCQSTMCGPKQSSWRYLGSWIKLLAVCCEWSQGLDATRGCQKPMPA